MKSWLATNLQLYLKITSRVMRIEKIQGDASYRIYSRIFLEDGSTYILMQMPKGKSEASEEITNLSSSASRIKEIPFINIQKTLQTRGLPVPKVFWYDTNESALLLEDLGAASLASQLDLESGPKKLARYRQSIDLLVKMEQVMTPQDNSCIAYQRSFDETLLNWEFHHFLEYGIEARLGHPLSVAARNDFIAVAARFTQKILKIPVGFLHRDYQSRNLMIRNDQLYLIDFQDALMGPYLYDLVALLRDSYSSLDAEELKSLIEYYQSQRIHYFGRADTTDDIWDYFHLLTVQRKLKDAGRFVYIDRVKDNPNFLKFIPTSLRYAKQSLGVLNKIREGQILNDFIQARLPEWDTL